MAVPATDMFGSSVALVIAGGYFGVEAFNHWKDRPIARWVFVAIASAFVLTGLFLNDLVRQVPRVGEIVSSVVTPTFWGVLLIGLFFVLRPLWQPKPQAAAPTPTGREERGARLGAKVNAHDAAIAEIRSRLDALPRLNAEADSEVVEAMHAALRETIKVHDDKVRKRLEKLETQYPKVIDDYQRMTGLEARLEDLIRKTLEVPILRLDSLEFALGESQKSLEPIYLALQALLARERVQRLTAAILQEGEFLMSRVMEHEPVKGGDWKEWQSHKTTFDSAMGHWMDIARGWHPKVEEWVNAMHPSQLTDGRWAGLDSLFEGSNAVITYQTFAIKYENWKRFEGHIQNAIHIAAFGGPNAIKILEKMGPEAPTLDAVKEVFPDDQSG